MWATIWKAFTMGSKPLYVMYSTSLFSTAAAKALDAASVAASRAERPTPPQPPPHARPPRNLLRLRYAPGLPTARDAVDHALPNCAPSFSLNCALICRYSFIIASNGALNSPAEPGPRR